jgi:hypothetical protein
MLGNVQLFFTVTLLYNVINKMATRRNFSLAFGVVAVIREPVKLVLEAGLNCICILYTKRRKLIIACIVKIRNTGCTSGSVTNTKSQLYRIRRRGMALLVELLRYKPQGFRFSMVSLEFFIVIILPGSHCEVLTTLPLSCADCLVIWEPDSLGTFRNCLGFYRDFFTFVRSQLVVRIKWIIRNNNRVMHLLKRKPIQYESRRHDFCSQMMLHNFFYDYKDIHIA